MTTRVAWWTAGLALLAAAAVAQIDFYQQDDGHSYRTEGIIVAVMSVETSTSGGGSPVRRSERHEWSQWFDIEYPGAIEYIELCMFSLSASPPITLAGSEMRLMVHLDSDGKPGTAIFEEAYEVEDVGADIGDGFSRGCIEIREPIAGAAVDAERIWVTVGAPEGTETELLQKKQHGLFVEPREGDEESFVFHRERRGGGGWLVTDLPETVRAVPLRVAVRRADETKPSSCEEHVTPYWHGRGGFVVQPKDGVSAEVRIVCTDSSGEEMEVEETLYPSDDGLIVQLLRKDWCFDEDGEPLQGLVSFTGITDGGWYWVSGERNAAVAPLACGSSLQGTPATLVGGITTTVTDTGTFIRHDTAKLIAVVPHIAQEGDVLHAPYWRGYGGIVGEPKVGESIGVTVECAGEAVTNVYDADGVIAELIRVPSCKDEDDNPVAGTMSVTGMKAGGWYWVDGDRNAAVAPLLSAAQLEGGVSAVIPGGVTVDEGPNGTFIDHDTAKLIAIVPKVKYEQDP